MEGQGHTMEEVWIKAEPLDVEPYVDINCDFGIKAEPSTEMGAATIADPLSPERVSIKSEITFGDYECTPASDPIQLTKNAASDKKRFHCLECGAKFPKMYLLTVHQRTYTGDRPFACNTCGKAFFTKQTLARHIISHSGERRYACEVCGMRFAQKCHVKPHQRKHTGDKPFSCNDCGMRFMYKYSLTVHEKTHLPASLILANQKLRQKSFACHTCGKAFYTNSDLVRHNRMHSGEKPFACDSCGKRFSQSGHLLAHKRSHSTSEAEQSHKLHDKQKKPSIDT